MEYIKWQSTWHSGIAFLPVESELSGGIELIGHSEDKSGAGNGCAIDWMDFYFDGDGKAHPVNGNAKVFQPHLDMNPSDPASMRLYVGFVIEHEPERDSNQDHGSVINYVIMESSTGIWYLAHQRYMAGNNVDCPAGESLSSLYTGSLDDLLAWPHLIVPDISGESPSTLRVHSNSDGITNTMVGSKLSRYDAGKHLSCLSDLPVIRSL